jgi:hypothetical protein
VSYSNDVSDEQQAVLEPMLRRLSKGGRRHGTDLRVVVDAMLYVAHTGCQWRMLPADFGLMRKLGLGTRGGALLAGPPGVGRSAVSRVVGAELVGDFTVILVDARTASS